MFVKKVLYISTNVKGLNQTIQIEFIFIGNPLLFYCDKKFYTAKQTLRPV